MKTLEDLKKDLGDFLALDRELLMSIYNDDLELDSDLDSAGELLEKVEHRIKSLGNYLSGGVKNENLPPQSDVKVSETDVKSVS
jgi:hypothetical protein